MGGVGRAAPWRDLQHDGTSGAVTGRGLLLVAIGTRGDVEPFARLGSALVGRGHRVSAAVLADGEARMRAAGVEATVVGPPSDRAMWSTSALVRTLAHANPGLMYLQMRARLARIAPTIAAGLRPLLAGTDAVLVGLAAAGLVPGLRAAGTPARLVLQAPVLPGATSTWSSTWGSRLPLPVETRRQHLLWSMTLGLSAALAREVGAGPPPGAGASSDPPAPDQAPSPPPGGQTPLLATSRVLDPAPGPRVEQTGWWADPGPVRPLPDDVDRYLRRHPGAVLLALGSLPGRDPDARAAALAAIASRVGRPAVVQVGGARIGRVPGGLVVGDVDHRALLPRVAAVVHHGGSGTTHAATAAGVPQVVVPHLGDQAHYARRVARAGLGPAPLPRAVATPARVAARLRTALDDPRHAQRAGAAVDQMLAEDGLATAVRLVEELVA